MCCVSRRKRMSLSAALAQSASMCAKRWILTIGTFTFCRRASKRMTTTSSGSVGGISISNPVVTFSRSASHVPGPRASVNVDRHTSLTITDTCASGAYVLRSVNSVSSSRSSRR